MSSTEGKPITLVPQRHLESTLLKADSTAHQIDLLCQEAVELRMLGVCVPPTWLPRAAGILAGTNVMLVSVVAFPLGHSLTATKVAEACHCLDQGAAEVDMVMNIGAMLSGEERLVAADIGAVAAACHAAGGRTKVILEMGYLRREQKVTACRLAVEAGADFVKTSTGFGPGGATTDDVALLRQTAPPTVGVKAAGGIRDLATAEAMLAAGADRIGTSAAGAIARAAANQGG